MTEKNTYLLNPETVEEMTRLARQGSLITQAIGLFPEGIDLSHLPSLEPDELRTPRLLDIGCGPGDWALDVAARYPHVQITGIDISQLMVSYATTEAANRELFNVDFQVMDALEPLPFADESFDVINIRVAVGFVPRERWSALFSECKRLVRRGGLLISIEGEGGVTTYQNPATAQALHWLAQALWVRGLGFWDGISSAHGIHVMQPQFFAEAGIKIIHRSVCYVDASYTSEQYQGWRDHPLITLQQIEPLVVNLLHVPSEKFHGILQECMREAHRETFRAHSSFQSIVGQKPQAVGK
ncbi:MAG TPA: class I SAM-dependent methyltransferase [Ktedonobacteraceae bacterium]|nr:class I SAM-dependent methyltransferase [Ktedonobacteraceae bacterium]